MQKDETYPSAVDVHAANCILSDTGRRIASATFKAFYFWGHDGIFHLVGGSESVVAIWGSDFADCDFDGGLF